MRARDFSWLARMHWRYMACPEATGDLHIWIDRDPANSERVWRALISFAAPVESLGVSVDDLGKPGIVVQVGVAPRRIDRLTDLTGLEFADAWTDRVVHSVEGIEVPFLGRRSLIQNKRASGRLKDLADLQALGESSPDDR